MCPQFDSGFRHHQKLLSNIDLRDIIFYSVEFINSRWDIFGTLLGFTFNMLPYPVLSILDTDIFYQGGRGSYRIASKLSLYHHTPHEIFSQ